MMMMISIRYNDDDDDDDDDEAGGHDGQTVTEAWVSEPLEEAVSDRQNREDCRDVDGFRGIVLDFTLSKNSLSSEKSGASARSARCLIFFICDAG